MKRFAGWAAAALALAAVAAGCGNRGGSLVGYQPEGALNAGSLTVEVDSANVGLAAVATVLMYTPVNRIRIYDDANHQGYLPNDALVEPERTFSTGWSLFRTPIASFDPTVSHALLARGSRDGRENLYSPLSNYASIPIGDAPGLIAPRDTIPLAPRASTVHPDAPPVIHVDSLYINVGVVASAQSLLLEIKKGNVTVYLALFQRQPDNSFARLVEFENVPPALNQTYEWRVDEFDRDARRVAATSVAGGFIIEGPKVAGNPFVWPSTSDRLIFKPWTIPGFVAVRPPGR